MTTDTNPPTPKQSGRNRDQPRARKARPTSRLDRLEALLTRAHGASIAEMTAATGWQAHSVRGAIAGALKKRGILITSRKLDGIRRYKAGKLQ